MNKIILGIIYILIAVFMIFASGIVHPHPVISLINGFLIGFVCMEAYLKAIED